MTPRVDGLDDASAGYVAALESLNAVWDEFSAYYEKGEFWIEQKLL